VFAVYIPPQAPAPGQALFHLIFFFLHRPVPLAAPSLKAETISTFDHYDQPESIVPQIKYWDVDVSLPSKPGMFIITPVTNP
jgi:hypothetical protein